MQIDSDPMTGTIAAHMLLTSSVTSLRSGNQTRGVAVNGYGLGITTLPIDETTEVVVAFSVSMARAMTDVLPQPVILFGGLDVTSNGMASDQAGHFYVASGDRGSSACEPNRSGALMVIPVDVNGLPLGLVPSANAAPATPAPLGVLTPRECFRIASTLDDIMSSRDVAVSPVDQSVFLTVNNTDRVLVILQP
jgi:hypothetical protein